MKNWRKIFAVTRMPGKKKTGSVSPLVPPEDKEENAGGGDSSSVQSESPKKSANSKKFCVLFRITNGLAFPHFAIIVTNVVLSIPVLLIIFAYFTRAIMADLEDKPEPIVKLLNSLRNSSGDKGNEMMMELEPDYGFPSKLYCVSYLTLSLFVEFFSQFLYTGGSILLLVGALRRNKRYCYTFVVCGILAFFLAALIRTGQFVLCDKNQTTKIKGRPHPYLPPLFKLTFIWLVCQLFWYWLVLSLVAALLNWMHAEAGEEEDDDEEKATPSTSSSSSAISTITQTRAPVAKKKKGKDADGDEEKNEEKF